MLNISTQNPIAFFCAEFGIESSLPIYAGGLGVLAGDILKEAADEKLPFVGVGLLYKGRGAVQQITSEGKQIEANLDFDPLEKGLEHVYFEEMPLFIKVQLTESTIWLRCWQKKIGETVTLYLLDPETEQNALQHRGIAHALYAGTEEDVIKQQLLLGIGGVKLLHTLGIHPALYHINEGRPSFLHWQLIRSYMDQNGMSFSEADRLATQRTVYTNHTLIEAGNQLYSSGFLEKYGQYYAQKMGIGIQDLLAAGQKNEDGKQFSITKYALQTARKASSVSKLHYHFCTTQWPQYKWVNITNGVHLPTWQSAEIAEVVNESGPSQPKKLWQAHQLQKQKLMEYVHHRTGFAYDPNKLVITWARRVAGYKQLISLFEDISRLQHILKKPGQEIQLLIAGKAHIYDVQAKQEIEQVIHYMQHELSGSALFVPNLDMELDMMLTRGSDVWLNTPILGREACGTSGMKAIINGVLQCTIADGWANEVDWKDIGWVLNPSNGTTTLAQSLYETLENQIVPLFYQKNADNISPQWIERMYKGTALSSQLSAQRMMRDYQQYLYEE
jgi:starch phosphorylase